jgi:hypothetical protein
LLLNKVVFSDVFPAKTEKTADPDAVLFFKFRMSNFSGLILMGGEGRKRKSKGRGGKRRDKKGKRERIRIILRKKVISYSARLKLLNISLLQLVSRAFESIPSENHGLELLLVSTI